MFHFGEDLKLRERGDWVSLLCEDNAAASRNTTLTGARLNHWRGHKNLTLDLIPNEVFLNHLNRL